MEEYKAMLLRFQEELKKMEDYLLVKRNIPEEIDKVGFLLLLVVGACQGVANFVNESIEKEKEK